MVAASPASYYLLQEPEAAAPGVMGPVARDEATGGFLLPHAMCTAQWTQGTSEGTLRTPAPKAKGKLRPQKCLHAAEEAGVGGAAGRGCGHWLSAYLCQGCSAGRCPGARGHPAAAPSSPRWRPFCQAWICTGEQRTASSSHPVSPWRAEEATPWFLPTPTHPLPAVLTR